MMRPAILILDAANGVISKNTKRHPKKLWSDKGVGEPIQLTVVEEDRAPVSRPAARPGLRIPVRSVLGFRLSVQG